jgi:hypothetical protein
MASAPAETAATSSESEHEAETTDLDTTAPVAHEFERPDARELEQEIVVALTDAVAFPSSFVTLSFAPRGRIRPL